MLYLGKTYNMKRWYLALAWLLLAQFSFAHDYYFSITEIDYNEQKGTLEMSIKVHTHDLEVAFKKMGTTCENSIQQSRFVGQADICLSDYFGSHLKVFQNGVKLSPIFVGKEEHLDGNSFIYFEFKGVKKAEAIEVVNTILTAHYSDQRNIVHFKKSPQSKNNTFYFNGINTHHTFELK